MFRKVLVCLDGSSLAEQMLPYATEIAERFGSSIVLLQVLHVPSSLAAASAQGAESVIEEEMRRLAFDARTYLERLAVNLRDTGIRVEAVTVEGTPGDAIVEYATANEVDFIAIATHGRRNIGRLVFGSVADHVLRNTCIPVLSVKPRETKK
jgi:nucleotide-binding universal stress UspA family protein